MADFDLDGDYDVFRSSDLIRNDFFDLADPNDVPGQPGIFHPDFGSGWANNQVDIIDFDPANGFHISAWADVDGDGDLDVALSAFAVGGFSQIYENLRIKTDPNNLNDPNLHTPEVDRRFVKVRPVKKLDNSGEDKPPYTENEFGAVAEIVIDDDIPGLRRRQFTSSSSGYLNQNEYTLTFGLPPRVEAEPPASPQEITFSVCVDFPCDPNHADPKYRGPTRVDGTINSVLQSRNLEDFYGTVRVFTVFRDGRVILPGETEPVDPDSGEDARLFTVGAPLVLPNGTDSMDDLTDPAGDDSFVALRFKHLHNSGNVRIREVILDGVLAAAEQDCANIVLVRIPSSGPVTLVHSMNGATIESNNRMFIPVRDEWILESDPNDDLTYEIRARVLKFREPVVKHAEETTAQHGIQGDGGRRVNNPHSTDRICTRVKIPATSSGDSAITIRFSPTNSSAP